MSTEWKPIETATPEDSPILGVRADGISVPSVWMWDAQPYHKKPKPYWARPFCPRHFDEAQAPTHWMAIPESPEAA